MISVSTMANGAIGEPQVMAESGAQPRSTAGMFRPVRSTMACAAGPTESPSRLKIVKTPTKPMPAVRAARNAFAGLMRKNNAMMKMTQGSMTVELKLSTYCTALDKLVVNPSIVFLLLPSAHERGIPQRVSFHP